MVAPIYRWKAQLVGVAVLAIAPLLALVVPVAPVLPSSPNSPAESQAARADQLFQQGNQQYRAGKLEAAIQLWQEARSLYQQSQNRSGEAMALANLGAAYVILERYREAVTILEECLPQAQLSRLRQLEAEALGNLGIAYRTLGRYGRAIATHRRAGKIMHELGDRRGLGQILLNLGNSFEAVGDYDSALSAYQQSLKLAQQTGDPSGEATAQANLGGIYVNLNRSEEAIAAFQQSLSLSKKLGDRAGQSSVLINLGSIYLDQEQWQQAIPYYQESLTLARQIKSRKLQAEALGSLAIAYEDGRDYPRAIAYLQQSLKQARAIADPQLESRTLNNLGHTLFLAGKLEQAEKALRTAITLLDGLRPELSDIYQGSIFDTQLHTYNLLQQVLIAASQPEAALEASEQGRARAFVALLARRLQSEAGQPPTPQSPTPHPQSPFTLTQIQQIARQQNATLVEYAIVIDDAFKFRGKQRSREQALYIWVVTPAGEVKFRQVDLKPLWQRNLTLTEVVTASRCLTETRACRSQLRSLSRGLGIVSNSQPTPESTVASDTAPTSNHNPALQILHQLLIAPIADLLPSDPKQRVIFIPQASLFLVPFPALQNPKGKYLIERHTILTAPAIQVLDLTRKQRQRLASSNVQSSPHSSRLIVGNPTMPRVGDAAPLPPLPGSEQEAIQIARLFGTTALTGDRATEAAIVQRLPQARWVHLATHGLLEYGNQDHSLQGLGVPGALALAPSKGRLALTSSTGDDGLLTASEILNLQLNAELMVLSACDSGQGRVTGDGVVGLSRALISAGVPSVLVSLWAVPDAPTARLMVDFYQNLQQHPDKAQALRQAMLAAMQEYPNPLNWAAFTLIGEPE
jgi:CHAT domain-containing protein/tetratricopeptide (TPR) repeat protein